MKQTREDRLLAEAYNNIVKFPGPAKTAKPTPKSGKVTQFPPLSQLQPPPPPPHNDKYYAKHGALEAINYIKQQLGNCGNVLGIWARESIDSLPARKAKPGVNNELNLFDGFMFWRESESFDNNMRDAWETMVEDANDDVFYETGKNNTGMAIKKAYVRLNKIIFRFKASKEYKDCISKSGMQA